jgi:hypothetical protein
MHQIEPRFRLDVKLRSTSYMLIAGLYIVVSLSSCFLFRPRFSKQSKKEDYFLYQKNFRDTTGYIKYNGVYKMQNDSLIGFLRFYPDGKVVRGGCYGDVKNITPNDCFDNELKISMSGYYLLRNDTVFMEMTDNAPISGGMKIYVWKMDGDTLTSLFSFKRDMLKKKNLEVIPTLGQDRIVSNEQKRIFFQIDLADRIKKDW